MSKKIEMKTTLSNGKKLNRTCTTETKQIILDAITIVDPKAVTVTNEVVSRPFTDNNSFFELCSATDYSVSALNDFFGLCSFAEYAKVYFPKTEKTRASKMTDRVLMFSASSGAGKMELFLMRPEGASIEELRTLRGAVESHLNSLKKAGFRIVKENKRYYYRPLTV